jgi:hypothetical protein
LESHFSTPHKKMRTVKLEGSPGQPPALPQPRTRNQPAPALVR